MYVLGEQLLQKIKRYGDRTLVQAKHFIACVYDDSGLNGGYTEPAIDARVLGTLSRTVSVSIDARARRTYRPGEDVSRTRRPCPGNRIALPGGGSSASNSEDAMT